MRRYEGQNPCAGASRKRDAVTGPEDRRSPRRCGLRSRYRCDQAPLVGRIRNARSESREAITALNEAVRLNPRVAPAQLELTRTHMSAETRTPRCSRRRRREDHPNNAGCSSASDACIPCESECGRRRCVSEGARRLRRQVSGGAGAVGVHAPLKNNPAEAESGVRTVARDRSEQLGCPSGITALDMKGEQRLPPLAPASSARLAEQPEGS